MPGRYGRRRPEVRRRPEASGVDVRPVGAPGRHRVVLVASFFVAYLMRTQLWYGGMLPLREFVWVLGLIVVLWPTLARSVGLTDSQTYLWPRRVFLC